MSKRLEDFINEHRDEFDELEPSMDLWDRIEKQLPATGAEPKKREAKTFSLGFVLRVAAAVIIIMGAGFVIFLRNQKTGVDLAAINPEYAKEQVRYASMVQTKRVELKQLSQASPELYQEFSAEIAKMDSVYAKLNAELATSPNQESVLEAMIHNLQIQTDVLNQQLQVIEQYNKMKNGQKNETKDI